MLSDLDSSPFRRGFRFSVESDIANISMPSTFLDNSKLTDTSFASLTSTPDSRGRNLSTSMNSSMNSPPITPYNEFIKRETRISSLSDEIQLFRRLSQDVNHGRIRHNRTQIVINLLNNLFTNGTDLPTDLRNECLEKLRNFQLVSFLKRNPAMKDTVDVDIPISKVKMTVHEQDLLRSLMKSQVSAKCSQLKTENEVISSMITYQGSKVSLPGSILDEEEGIILDRIAETAQLIQQCSENLKSVIDLNEELCDLRATKFRELQKTELENLTSKTKLINLQIKNLNYTIEDAFVQQFDNMAEAVNVLHRELQNSLHEVEYTLEKTQSLKNKYDRIRGTSKFDDILNEYTQLRDSYKHKSWALKQITNNNNNNTNC